MLLNVFKAGCVLKRWQVPKYLSQPGVNSGVTRPNRVDIGFKELYKFSETPEMSRKGLYRDVYHVEPHDGGEESYVHLCELASKYIWPR